MEYQLFSHRCTSDRVPTRDSRERKDSMRYAATIFGGMLVLALGACGDSQEGTTSETPTVFPNGKAYKVSTVVEPSTIRAGETATVTCSVVDTSDRAFDTPTTFTVTPESGVSIDGNVITAGASGTYKVVCRAPDVDVADDLGADLIVEAGAAASIEAVVEPATVAAGETATVTCNVKDADGGIISGVATTVTAPSDVDVDGNAVSSETAGSYDITCTANDDATLPSTPAVLTVTAGAAVSVTLLADPEKEVYARGDAVKFSWVAADSFGNPITDAPGALSSPSTGVEVVGDVADNRFRFVEQGFYDWTVTLSGDAGVSDTLSLICDDQGPEITITYPPRGATLTGADGDVVTVTGTVTENLGTIEALVINGVAAALDDNGNFQAALTPEWGTNFVGIYANDSHGNQGKLTPSFQFTSSYVSFVEADAQGVKVDDGAQALLGQGVLDDGVHDPADIDDLATLLEVVLTNIDIPAALQGQNGAVVTQVFPLQGVSLFSGLFTLDGDVTVAVRIVSPTDIGPTAVTLDSTTGGVDTEIALGDQLNTGLVLNLEVDVVLSAEAKAAGINVGTASGTATIPNQATSQTITVNAKLILDKPPGGDLTAGIEGLNLGFSNLDLDVLTDVEFTFTLQFPIGGPQTFTVSLTDLGLDLQSITDALIDPLVSALGGFIADLVAPLLEGFASDALQGLIEQLQLSFDFELPDFLGTGKDPVAVNVYTELTSALFLDEGGQIGLGLGAYAPKGASNTHEPDGAIKRSGCLVGDSEELVYDWGSELGFGLQTDSLNMVFFALWWSGFIHGPIDVGSLLGDSAPIPLDDFVLDLDPYASPVINDCSKADGVLLEWGDVEAKIAGNLLGLGIDATVFLDLQLLVNFDATEEGLFVVLEDLKYFDVEVVAVGPDVSEADNRMLLEEQLEPLLATFLVGESFGPIEIPSLSFDGLIPGLTLPPGTDTSLDLGPIEVTKDSGYVLIETDLD